MAKPSNTTDENHEPFLLKEMSGHVLWLTMNRAKTRNTLSLGMIAALQSSLDEANNDDNVRVIVIAALGPVFSAGHDLREMGVAKREVLENCTNMMMTISHGTKPVIASIVGTATAGGCQLVSTCDLAIASELAHFCLPGTNIGGFCTTPLVGIGRKIQRKHAMEMALTGDMFTAEDALRFGLINRVVSPEELRVETEVLAQKIASKSSVGIGLGKKAFYQQVEMPIKEAYAFATEKMIEVMETDDAAEGTKAFFEKRDPQWKGI